MPSIADCMFFAISFIDICYRWCRDGEVIDGDDKFYAKNGPPPTAKEIKEKNLCIVCTGLINLMRRFMGLSIPGLDGSMGDDGLRWPGTTGIWFEYLMARGLLEEYDDKKEYPVGTLYLRNFRDIKDQGHVAVKIGENKIIHAYADVDYDESIEKNITDVGRTGITDFNFSHNMVEGGYYTHICLPENWIEKE